MCIMIISKIYKMIMSVNLLNEFWLVLLSIADSISNRWSPRTKIKMLLFESACKGLYVLVYLIWLITNTSCFGQVKLEKILNVCRYFHFWIKLERIECWYTMASIYVVIISASATSLAIFCHRNKTTGFNRLYMLLDYFKVHKFKSAWLCAVIFIWDDLWDICAVILYLVLP